MLRKLFTESHPWLMQALGGLIAVIILIPIGGYVVYQFFVNNPPPESASPRYQVPPAQGVGSGAATPGASGGGNIVMMQPGNAPAGFVFSPATLTVKAGTTVTWKDADTTPHNIVGQGSAASVISYQANGAGTGPYSVKFTKPGTYKYVCTLHQGMIGQITVQ